jgi:hypothetical protein
MCLERLKQTMKNLMKDTHVSAEILNRHLPNTSQKRYYWNEPFFTFSSITPILANIFISEPSSSLCCIHLNFTEAHPHASSDSNTATSATVCSLFRSSYCSRNARELWMLSFLRILLHFLHSKVHLRIIAIALSRTFRKVIKLLFPIKSLHFKPVK